MNHSGNEFEQLVSEALAQEFSGWDFIYLRKRMTQDAPPWDYSQIVRAALPSAHSLLDMGTGGGELLSSLAPLPVKTFATEAYAPNVPVARARLEPLGVQVVALESDNALPFEDGQFDLVINRHESYDIKEVSRVLAPGGRFITQQVGGKDNFGLNTLLQDEPWFEYGYWDLDYALEQFKNEPLRVTAQAEAYVKTIFTDIGAVVFYLKVIPWQIAGFSIERYHQKLLQVHQHILKNNQLVVYGHRFMIEAVKVP
jgi:SAM-dependent methyltransferase